MTDIPMPTTIKELWDTGWVAENEDEAVAQARRMFDLFAGKKVSVDRLSFLDGDNGYGEVDFVEPWPEVEVDYLEIGDWDGDVLYAEWHVYVVNPDQVVTSRRGEQYRLGDLEGPLFTTAPGIGTEAGFGNKDRLIFPEPEAVA